MIIVGSPDSRTSFISGAVGTGPLEIISNSKRLEPVARFKPAGILRWLKKQIRPALRRLPALGVAIYPSASSTVPSTLPVTPASPSAPAGGLRGHERGLLDPSEALYLASKSFSCSAGASLSTACSSAWASGLAWGPKPPRPPPLALPLHCFRFFRCCRRAARRQNRRARRPGARLVARPEPSGTAADRGPIRVVRELKLLPDAVQSALLHLRGIEIRRRCPCFRRPPPPPPPPPLPKPPPPLLFCVKVSPMLKASAAATAHIVIMRFSFIECSSSCLVCWLPGLCFRCSQSGCYRWQTLGGGGRLQGSAQDWNGRRRNSKQGWL